jgi:hypothetical protein
MAETGCMGLRGQHDAGRERLGTDCAHPIQKYFEQGCLPCLFVLISGVRVPGLKNHVPVK